MEKSLYFCTRFRKEEVCFFREQEGVEILKSDAEIAQLVEHDLAKVGVASSSLVFRSKQKATLVVAFFCFVEKFVSSRG